MLFGTVTPDQAGALTSRYRDTGHLCINCSFDKLASFDIVMAAFLLTFYCSDVNLHTLRHAL